MPWGQKAFAAYLGDDRAAWRGARRHYFIAAFVGDHVAHHARALHG